MRFSAKKSDFWQSYNHFSDFSEIAFKVREMYENPYIPETSTGHYATTDKAFLIL